MGVAVGCWESWRKARREVDRGAAMVCVIVESMMMKLVRNRQEYIFSDGNA